MRKFYWRKLITLITAFSMLMMASVPYGTVTLADEKRESVSEDKSGEKEREDEVSADSAKDSPSEDKTGVSEYEDSVSEDKAEWTVMLYLCGTDLETDQMMGTENLSEISRTYPNDSVNMLIQTGGTKKWHTEDLEIDIDPKKTQRFSYDEEGFTLVDEKPLQNMANSETLSEFITWGTKEYPAEKYMLVLWDHGAGSAFGLITDELHNNAMMTLYDLEKALDKAGTDFEVVAVDCCLMASLEMAGTVKDHAKYLVASEEVMPGEGSAYEEWLQYLYDIPECDGREIGTEFCDSLQQKYVELGDDMSSAILTASVIDLGEIGNVEAAFDDFFTKIGEMTKDPVEYSNYLYYARLAEEYCGGRYGMVDLFDLADKARKNGIAEKEATKLNSAVSRAVLHDVKGKGRSYSHGLSYFDGVSETPPTLDSYVRLAKSIPYLAYLDAVHMDWTAPDWVYEKTEPLGDITYDDYGLGMELEIGDDGDLELVVDEGMTTIVSVDYNLYIENEDGGWDKLGTGDYVGTDGLGKGYFSADFQGVWPAIGDEFCYMEIDDETEAYVRYFTPVYVEEVDEDNPDSADKEGTVLNLASAFLKGDADEDETYDEGFYEIYGFMNEDEIIENNSLPGRGTFSLNMMDGAVLRLLYRTYDELTGSEIYDRGNTITVSRNMIMEEKELPAGEYGYSFLVTDMTGKEIETDMAFLSWDGETAEYTLPEDEGDIEEYSVSDNEAEEAEDEGSVSDNEAEKADDKASVSDNEAEEAGGKSPVSGNEAEGAKGKGSVSDNKAERAEEKESVSDSKASGSGKHHDKHDKHDKQVTENKSQNKQIDVPHIENTILNMEPYGKDFDYLSYYAAYAKAWEEFNP